MRTTTLFPALLALLTVIIVSACSLDPWVTGKEYPDVVPITKITKFGKSSDGASPMKSKVGTVIFSHKTHEKEGLKCVACHHKTGNPERIKQCASCHIGDNGYVTMHGLCVDCHIAKKEGPQECKQCH